jgi:hypothetical protein
MMAGGPRGCHVPLRICSHRVLRAHVESIHLVDDHGPLPDTGFQVHLSRSTFPSLRKVDIARTDSFPTENLSEFVLWA